MIYFSLILASRGSLPVGRALTRTATLATRQRTRKRMAGNVPRAVVGVLSMSTARSNSTNRSFNLATWFQCLCKMVQKIEQGTREAEPEYALGKDYQWYEMMVLSRWDFTGKCQILCVDVPFDLPERLQTAHEERAASVDFRDPFAMHVHLWDQMIVYWDISVWRVRDPVRQLEKVGKRSLKEPRLTPTYVLNSSLIVSIATG